MGKPGERLTGKATRVEPAPGHVFKVAGTFEAIEDRWVPERVEYSNDGEVDGRPSAYVKLELRDGRPHLAEVRLVSRPGQREIRPSDIKALDTLSPHELMAFHSFTIDADEQAASAWREGYVSLKNAPTISYPWRDGGFTDAAATLKRARGQRVIDRKFLERVAAIYRENIDHAPTQAVKKTFIVSDRMASEYVQRARRAGLLPPTTPGKKKG